MSFVKPCRVEMKKAEVTPCTNWRYSVKRVSFVVLQKWDTWHTAGNIKHKRLEIVNNSYLFNGFILFEVRIVCVECLKLNIWKLYTYFPIPLGQECRSVQNSDKTKADYKVFFKIKFCFLSNLFFNAA